MSLSDGNFWVVDKPLPGLGGQVPARPCTGKTTKCHNQMLQPESDQQIIYINYDNLPTSELQIREGIEPNLKIIFLISQ